MELNDISNLMALASALAMGLLIGAERGWKARKAAEGERVAGLRTYGLIGLLGGIAGFLSNTLGVIALAAIFIGFTVAATVAYTMQRKTTTDVSMTGLVAMMLTFVLGALATLGHISLAAVSVVVITLLLGMKSTLHEWLRKLEKEELSAAMQLLLISVVLLPVLPNQGYGPWDALNPYEIWWMVVLIASISFVGYFSIKIVGPQKGLMLTAIAGGLASSTALTLEFARLSKKKKSLNNILVSGILTAGSIMYMRVLLVAGIVNPQLLLPLFAPLGGMTILSIFLAMFFLKKEGDKPAGNISKFTNPLDIRQALFFGVILAAVILLSQAAIHWFGTYGLYLLAAFSGIADVDAITLSLSKMSSSDITLNLALWGIVIASATNTITKVILAFVVAGMPLAKKLLIPLVAVTLLGIAICFLA